MKDLAVAAFAFSVLAAPAGVGAAVPCWKAVQVDWYQHGRVTKTYPLSCYPLAIKKLPADLATYGGAAEDIHKAYLRAKARLHQKAKKR